MPGQESSGRPASWSIGSGLPTRRESRIDAGRTPSESGAPTTPAGSSAEVRSLFPMGTVLRGKYRLDRIVGIGGMGTVFAATHLRNANRVAIKILHPGLGRDSAVVARFLREGYAANSVRHAGTVRVLDDDTAEGGAVFLVMELLEGETVEALWQRRARRLSPSEVAELMCQALDILSAAHERGIVHRDVKPDNLFVERDGTLRVLDFGVARVLEGTLKETRDGSVIGTLPFMSPEQMLGKINEVDARSDVWSVGATAFALVSGCFVHEAETPEEMLVFTASRQALSLARVAPHAPRAFIEVVDRALRFDKRERWANARAMRAAFAEFCRSAARAEKELDESERPTPAQRVPLQGRPRLELPLQSWLGSAANDTTPATRRVARWASVAVVAALAFGVVAALTATHRRSPPEAQGTALAVASPDVAARPPPQANRIDPTGWVPSSQPSAVPLAPSACTPAFTVVPVTGEKIWKDECL